MTNTILWTDYYEISIDDFGGLTITFMVVSEFRKETVAKVGMSKDMAKRLVKGLKEAQK